MGMAPIMKLCVDTRLDKGKFTISCKMGLWAVSGADESRVENEARHYFSQYLGDGEYAELLALMADECSTMVIDSVKSVDGVIEAQMMDYEGVDGTTHLLYFTCVGDRDCGMAMDLYRLSAMESDDRMATVATLCEKVRELIEGKP